MGPMVFLPLGAGAVLWLIGPRLSRVLPPPTAVRLLTLAGLVTALATGFVLAVAGFVALAQIGPVAALGHWSVALVKSSDQVPLPIGAGAGLVVLTLMAAAIVRTVRAVRDFARAAAVCRRLPSESAGLVVVDDEHAEAFALPGPRGRIVVSTGMLRALSAPERRVLLAHEEAHLRHRHHFYLAGIDLAAAANPLLASTARSVHVASERWADECAATEVGDRRLAARALARAALARADSGRFAGGHRLRLALEATHSGVPDRVRRLLESPPRARRGTALVLVSLILVTAAAAIDTARDTEMNFEQASSARF